MERGDATIVVESTLPEHECSETKPLLYQHSSKHDSKEHNSETCFPRIKCQPVFIREKGPVMMIIWNTLIVTSLSVQGVYMLKKHIYPYKFLIGTVSAFTFPIIGWLADVKIGRYRIM